MLLFRTRALQNLVFAANQNWCELNLASFGEVWELRIGFGVLREEVILITIYQVLVLAAISRRLFDQFAATSDPYITPTHTRARRQMRIPRRLKLINRFFKLLTITYRFF